MRARQRDYDKATFNAMLAEGLHPVAARVAAARVRGEAAAGRVRARLADLDSPWGLPDIHSAVQRIAAAIRAGERISLACDHDADGVTATAVLHEALVRLGHPEHRIVHHTSHRLNEGYGLSDALVDRMLADPERRPDLVITADHGSSDGPRIARLAEQGIDTVVTDHHMIPVEGLPEAAVAVVSPARPDADYPDPTIAGCMVAWLVVTALRAHAIEQGLVADTMADFRDLLSIVAVGTQADCVDLSGRNNRAVLRAGLAQIRDKNRPCWAVLDAPAHNISSEYLAFQVCPRLASPGRTDDASPGIQYLLASTTREACEWHAVLCTENERRKAIQRELAEDGLAQARAQYDANRAVLCVRLTEGHAGVHGLVASRALEQFGRPAIMVSPKVGAPGLLTGSCRAPDAVHMRDALQAVADAHPSLLVAFGGHRAAAGFTLNERDFDTFAQAIEGAVADQLDGNTLEPVIHTDGELQGHEFDLHLLDELARLEPYGTEFESPVFTGRFRVLYAQAVGRPEPTHASLLLEVPGGDEVRAVWFHACEPGESLTVNVGDEPLFAYNLTTRFVRGQHRLQLIVRAQVE